MHDQGETKPFWAELKFINTVFVLNKINHFLKTQYNRFINTTFPDQKYYQGVRIIFLPRSVKTLSRFAEFNAEQVIRGIP